jgi:threonine/homoserine/homoserine lactone efflux protein
MPEFGSILSVILAGFALSATPGPSMLYVLSRSVGQSRAAGLASALGLCVGGMLLAIATAIGLASIFDKFDWLVTVLSYAGSAYLIWLGIQMILRGPLEVVTAVKCSANSQESLLNIIWQGILVELLNPKTVLFFALFLPPFVNRGDMEFAEGSVQLQLLILGLLIPLTAIPADLAVAYLGGTITKFVCRKTVIREWLGWVGGVVLIVIALNLQVAVL